MSNLPLPLPTATTKTNATWSRGTTRAQHYGVWTKFVEFLGINIWISTTSDTDERFRFESMRTDEFLPDEAYISAVLGAAPAAVERRVKRLRRPVFMVTGVKTVSVRS